MLASYACDPMLARSRLYKEASTPYRNEFERDRDRIIHSNAFRRLQYKTQVFVNHEGDHYRNRLTHSIEVSSVARSISKMLNLSDDLAESVALAHDIGHTPFGHAGEEALNECIKEYQPFSHNAHSLKLITQLECRYASYNGLNLTWEVLEGIVKHNGPIVGRPAEYIAEYNNINDLELHTYASAEAQVASLSDDIAYICHDLEDSIRAQILNFKDIVEIELLDRFIVDLKIKFSDISSSRLIYELVRKLIHHLIENLLRNTQNNIKLHSIKTPEDIRLLGSPLVVFTKDMEDEVLRIKEFLFKKVYKHEKVRAMNRKSKTVVTELFSLYCDNYKLLPENWHQFIDHQNSKTKALVVADYIAGMTDRFAINQYLAHCNTNFDNI